MLESDSPRLIRREGHAMWLFTDGRLLPVIAGGDGTDGAGDGGSGDGGADAGDPPDLGEAGKRAIAAERETAKAAQKAAREAEKRLKTLESELAKFRDADKTELEKQVEVARREAAAEATTQATQAFNRRLLEAEVKGAAAGKLSDPADAVRLLDLDDFTVADDGTIDTKPIAKAIEQLLKEKPYLSAGDPRRPSGSADQGPQGAGNGAGGGTDPGALFGRLVADKLRR